MFLCLNERKGRERCETWGEDDRKMRKVGIYLSSVAV